MRDYILFVDTETSGIPRNWDAPYSDEDSWPYLVQLAWEIHTKEGEKVKAQNFYIYDATVGITQASTQIHGITQAYLKEYGVERKVALEQISNDLKQYKPLVVAHSMQLDYHMLGVCFFRAGMENPLLNLPLFCTMKASSSFLLQKHQRFLRLGELYERLFGEPLVKEHDAKVDAQATAKCFFKLFVKGDITPEQIKNQEAIARPDSAGRQKPGCSSTLLLVLIISILLTVWR